MTFGSGEIDPSQSHGGGTPVRNSSAPANQVTFSRRELNRILDLMAARSPPANGAIMQSTS